MEEGYSEEGEIEHLYVFSHGWYIDNDETIAGGLQIGSGNYDSKQITADDFSNTYYSSLSNRFSSGADIYLNACNVGKGTLPQKIAGTYNTTVYAYKNSLKFFELGSLNYGAYSYTMMIPFVGSVGKVLTKSEVYMSPSIGVGNIALPIPVKPIKFITSKYKGSAKNFRYSKMK